MGLLAKLLLLPVTGPVRGFQFILEQIQAEAEAILQDEGRVQAELIDLSLRHDMGEVADAEYTEQEEALLARLNAIREHREGLLEYRRYVEDEDA